MDRWTWGAPPLPFHTRWRPCVLLSRSSRARRPPSSVLRAAPSYKETPKPGKASSRATGTYTLRIWPTACTTRGFLSLALRTPKTPHPHWGHLCPARHWAASGPPPTRRQQHCCHPCQPVTSKLCQDMSLGAELSQLGSPDLNDVWPTVRAQNLLTE